ncbi:MAG: class I SAM-dependent methyltransferase [Sneathiella sp.]
MKQPSRWISKNCTFFQPEARILDVACGAGRHSDFLGKQGFSITAVDRDIDAVMDNAPPNTEIVQADLEGERWPFEEAAFGGIVVVNYLWRPLFADLKRTMKTGGILLYDTFAVGNEKYGRPRSPDFLLKPSELKEIFSDFEILAWEEGYYEDPSPAVRQSIAVRKPE